MSYKTYIDYPVEHLPYDIIVVSDGKVAEVYDKKGRRIYSSSDHDKVLDEAFNRAPADGVVKLLEEFTIKSQHIIPKNLVIDGYGAKFVAGATTTAARMIMPDSNVVLHIKGLKMDLAGIWGVGTGADTTRTAATLILEDVEIIGINNYGISQTGDNGKVILRRVKLKGVEPDGSDNECLLTEDQEEVIVEDCEIYGNKPYYLAAKKVRILRTKVSTEGYNTAYHSPINAEDVEIQSVEHVGSNITVRPYGDVHLDVVYSSLKRLIIEDVKLLEPGTASSRIEVRPYDDTYIAEQVIIRNIKAQKTPISIRAWTSHSKVKQLIIENVEFEEFSAAHWILDVDDCDIDFFIIKNIRMPDTNLTNSALADFGAVNSNISVRGIIKDVYAPYDLDYSISFRDDGATGYSVDGEIDMRELKPRPIRKVTTVVVNATVKQKNSGVATIASGSTSVTVNHGLVAKPRVVIVTPYGNTKVWVPEDSITDTSFDIVTDTAPSEDLKVAWYAEV